MQPDVMLPYNIHLPLSKSTTNRKRDKRNEREREREKFRVKKIEEETRYIEEKIHIQYVCAIGSTTRT